MWLLLMKFLVIFEFFHCEPNFAPSSCRRYLAKALPDFFSSIVGSSLHPSEQAGNVAVPGLVSSRLFSTLLPICFQLVHSLGALIHFHISTRWRSLPSPRYVSRRPLPRPAYVCMIRNACWVAFSKGARRAAWRRLRNETPRTVIIVDSKVATAIQRCQCVLFRWSQRKLVQRVFLRAQKGSVKRGSGNQASERPTMNAILFLFCIQDFEKPFPVLSQFS